MLQTIKIGNQGENVSRAKTWILSSDAVAIASLSNISKNLTDSYKQFDKNLLEVKLDQNGNYNFYLDLFIENPPDLIIVTHPLVIAHPFFAHLLGSPESFKIKFIIHTVGDFLRRSLTYVSLEHLFQGKDIHWIFPSNGYAAVTKSMFQNPEDIHALMIPVSGDFFYSKSEQESSRQDLGLQEDEICFLYTGRIGEQKNIELSIKLVKNSCMVLGKKFKFFIVGPVDDYEGASIGIPKKLGSTYKSIASLLDENVLMVSSQDKKKLRRYYNAADVFVSLSCYHDESFGLSPLEALSSGTPCILSQWGGYRDFHYSSSRYCHLVSLSLDQEGFHFSKDDFLKALREIIQLKSHDRSHKEDCSNTFLKKYSSATFLRFLESHVFQSKKSFSGFSAKYRKLAMNNILEDKSFSKEYARTHHYDVKLKHWKKSEYENIYGPMWGEWHS